MQKFNKTAIALAAALALPGLASAQDAQLPISANVTFTTDYVFRGISQTNEKFAVQGGFDWTSESTGIYVGTWASNISYDEASVELDGYVGWAKSFGDFGVDVGWLHYNYPGESVLNTDEVYVTGSWKWISASYYYTASSEWFGLKDARGSGYLLLGAEYTFPMGFTVGGTYGSTMLSGDDPDLPLKNDFLDYEDYKVYVGYSDATYTGLDYELAYTDTSFDNDAVKTDIGPIADDRVFFSVSKSF